MPHLREARAVVGDQMTLSESIKVYTLMRHYIWEGRLFRRNRSLIVLGVVD